MVLKKIYVVALFTILFQCCSFAQESIIPDLSSDYVDKLINLAIANYPRVKSLDNHLEIAKSTIKRTTYSYFDPISVSYVYPSAQTIATIGNKNTTSLPGVQAGVFLSLGTLLEKPYQIKEAKQNLIIAQNDKDEYLLTLATTVKKRYYAYIQALTVLKLQTKTQQTASLGLNTMKDKFEKGEDTYENYNAAQNNLTNSTLAKIQAETNYFSAKADLEEMIGTSIDNVK